LGGFIVNIVCRNPSRPEVKLAQTVYWMDCLSKFSCSSSESVNYSNISLLPAIVCGDFNSVPDSEPYRYMTQNGVRIFSEHSSSCMNYIRQLTDLSYNGTKVKFLCDSSLSRLCRWMRALGIDVSIDRVEGKIRETKDFNSFFERARSENRVILTTSRLMRERANCPRSTYVNTKNLEESLASICREYSVKLDKESILTGTTPFIFSVFEITQFFLFGA
jgi:Mut7-C RNAse domain